MRHPRSLLVLFAVTACPPPAAPCGPGTHELAGVCVIDTVDAGPPDAGAPDAGLPDAGRPPPLEAEANCAHLLGGPSGPTTSAGLSGAHAGVRFFGPVTRFGAADDVLSNALEAPALGPPALIAYGAALPGVCVVRAEVRSLPAARVERVGAVAVIHPGTGAVSVPADATAVAIDLRGLPNAPGLEAALEAATAEALSLPLPRAGRTVREHRGYSSEIPGPSVYENAMTVLTRPVWPGHAAAALPVAVMVDEAAAPKCAELAGTLRLSQRAWLFGGPVLASVAESSWAAWGELGLGYRSMNLMNGAARWPDVIAPDDAAAALASLATRGAPPAVVGAADRPALVAIDNHAVGARRTLSIGTARAVLVTIHGALRRFFPYFPVVGDHIDERLAETLATLDAAPTLDRKLLFDTVSRLGEAVHDGHNFIFDTSGEVPRGGGFAVIIDQVAGEPAVQKSLEPLVQPGDVIVSIAGTPTAQWYATELPRTAGSTSGHRFELATQKYLELFGPTAFGLRAIDGGTRTVTVAPAAAAVVEQLYAEGRHAERLGALGAADIQYINLDGAGLTAAYPCSAAMTQAQGAAGVVLDMRGYPGEEGFACMANLARQRMASPQFRVPVWAGPDDFRIDASGQWFVDPATPAFLGPVVLIVGPGAVSAAETIAMILVDAQRLKKIVGRQSAGTNGNITYLSAPAGIFFSFTGMEVLHTDGGTYHGVGIVPDIEVQPTAEDFATGRDRSIEAAISALRAP